MKHRLFRCIPPWPLVIQILDALHIPTDLPCTFVKGSICIENSAELACNLEPYYVPCKAKIFLEETDEKRWITILRHILKPHGWEIKTMEITRDKKKMVQYTIQRIANIIVDEIKMDFL